MDYSLLVGIYREDEDPEKLAWAQAASGASSPQALVGTRFRPILGTPRELWCGSYRKHIF